MGFLVKILVAVGCLWGVEAGEVIDCKFAGLGSSWENPIFFSYHGGNVPGTTFTVRASGSENSTVVIKDIAGKSIFKYRPKRFETKMFLTTISLEKNGIRIFDHGQESGYYVMNIKTAAHIGVVDAGFKAGYLAYNEPLWAQQYVHKHVRIDQFGSEGTEVPFKFSLVEYSSELHQLEDYVVIIGEVLDSPSIQIVVKDSEGEKIPMHINIKTKIVNLNDPVMNIGTFDAKHPRLMYNDTTLDRGINLEGRFAIAIVREHLGWKIYINGELYHFFFDRYSPLFAKEVQLFGKNEASGGWKLLKLIRKHN